jgi:hypothetical protein
MAQSRDGTNMNTLVDFSVMTLESDQFLVPPERAEWQWPVSNRSNS